VTKVCTICGAEKDFSEFHRDPRGKFGLYARCKDCHNAMVRERYRCPEEKAKRRQRLSRQRDHINARQRSYAARDPERWRLYYSEYHRANTSRDQALARVHARRARRLGNGGSHTEAEWVDLCARHGNICLACGRPLPLTRDHVVPLIKGGSDSIDNLQPLCGYCNSSKGTRVIDYRPCEVDLG